MNKPTAEPRGEAKRTVIVRLDDAGADSRSATESGSHAFLRSLDRSLNARPLFPEAGERISEASAMSAMSRKTPKPVPEDLRRYMRIDASCYDEAKALCSKCPTAGVKAYVEPLPRLPVLSAMNLGGGRVPGGTTGSFEARQSYLEDTNEGMGIRFAWTKAGDSPGAGVRAADIEKGWMLDHEDFDNRISMPWGSSRRAADKHHGTACLGLAVGRPDTQGIRGIAPNVDELHCFSVGNDQNIVPDAIQAARDVLDAGDVLLIELDAPAEEVGNRNVPMEFWDATYDAVRAAVAEGIIVVAAAGNGGLNLGDPALDGAFTTRPDSGAILVGAGGGPGSTIPDRARIPMSNFGARVNVQAYGAAVCTTGLGDLQAGSDQRRWYTHRFNGTSSAAALVWASCILLQSIAKRHGKPLTPASMRQLLTATGRPQQCGGRPCADPIGPRPHLKTALTALRIP